MLVSVSYATDYGFGGSINFKGFRVTVKHTGKAYREQVLKLTEETAKEYYGNSVQWEKFIAAKNTAGTVFYFS